MLIAELRRVYRTALRERVPGAHREHHLVVEQRNGLHATIANARARDAQIDHSAEKSANRTRGCAWDDSDVDAGMPLPKRVQYRRKPVVARVTFGRDAERRLTPAR